MKTDASLSAIRTRLFHGLLSYTKSFPDFSISQRFTMAGPRQGNALLETTRDDLLGNEHILIYVHFPFCSSECVFCNSFPQKSNTNIQHKYLEHLEREIDLYGSLGIFQGKTVKCVYLGGGTPTTFSSDAIRGIVHRLRQVAEFSEDCSITCEAHVRDLLEEDRVGELARSGINRISTGCQTFDSDVLKSCRRFHRQSQVAAVVRDARQQGVSTNIDMMLGLPGQSLEAVRKDLGILAEIAPDSIEYMRHEVVNPLAISLYREKPELLVEDDELFWMTYETQHWMEENGYEQNGHFTSEKQFPYRYHWLKEVPFISLGARSRSHSRSLCCDKHEDLSLYFRLIEKGRPPIARYMALDKRDQMYRSLFLGIQLRNGLSLTSFEDRFEENALEVFSPLMKDLIEWGCIEPDSSSIRLSRHGRFFVEDVCCHIIDQSVGAGDEDAKLERLSHSTGAFSERRASRLKLRERD